MDNGDLSWSITIPPLNSSTNIDSTRWFEWLESIRKDVKCTFGILKERWRILKAGVRLHGVDVADDIWKTCSALYNILLQKDGLTEEWTGELSLFDLEYNEVILFALRRLQSSSEMRNYDCSGMGPGNCVQHRNHVLPSTTIGVNINLKYEIDDNGNDKILVNDLPMNDFRDKIIDHFDILYHQ